VHRLTRRSQVVQSQFSLRKDTLKRILLTVKESLKEVAFKAHLTRELATIDHNMPI